MAAVYEPPSDRAQEIRSEPRTRGNVRRCASFQVWVNAGIDSLTGRQHYLPASTTDAREARRILTRLQAEVDEQRNARTKATLRAALDAWLRVHEIEPTTRQSYEGYIRLHIGPALGHISVGKVTAQVLEEFYAELRRCRSRCGGRPGVDHRTTRPHECRRVRHRRRPGRPTPQSEAEHDCQVMGCVVVECPPHECRPLSASTIRQIHFTISAALGAAVRWDWIKSNPAEVARKPRQPQPEPDPPTAEQAARIIATAWDQDDAWGTLVWLAMVTGMRRGELLALRWLHLDLVGGMLHIRRNYVGGVEKDTKTHEIRRITLDKSTVEVLTAHRQQYEDMVRKLDREPTGEAYLFSYAPLHDRPCNPDGVRDNSPRSAPAAAWTSSPGWA